MNMLSQWRQIRSAIWLFLVYAACAKDTGEPPWVRVAEGRAISDREVAPVLSVPVRTVRKWRKRLENLGVIQCVRAGRGRYQTYVQNLYLGVNADAEIAAAQAAHELANPVRKLIH